MLEETTEVRMNSSLRSVARLKIEIEELILSSQFALTMNYEFNFPHELTMTSVRRQLEAPMQNNVKVVRPYQH